MKAIVLDAQHTIFEGVVSEAVLPAEGGQLTILDDHEFFFAALQKGYVRLTPLVKVLARRIGGSADDGATGIKPIFIRKGLARMKNNELVILVE